MSKVEVLEMTKLAGDGETPFTVGKLKKELAKYPDDYALTVSVTDKDDCAEVVPIVFMNGFEKENGEPVKEVNLEVHVQ